LECSRRDAHEAHRPCTFRQAWDINGDDVESSFIFLFRELRFVAPEDFDILCV
jgi:hypothetical protein